MKSFIRIIAILLTPILIVVIVNETYRSSIKGNLYYYKGFATINSSDKILNRCSWNCHNNTAFCKQHHVKLLNDYFSTTDKLYYGEITLLNKTGDYQVANIAILVILFPFFILYFSLKGWTIRQKIKKMKTNA
jgi:hypothetical protein